MNLKKYALLTTAVSMMTTGVFASESEYSIPISENNRNYVYADASIPIDSGQGSEIHAEHEAGKPEIKAEELENIKNGRIDNFDVSLLRKSNLDGLKIYCSEQKHVKDRWKYVSAMLIRESWRNHISRIQMRDNEIVHPENYIYRETVYELIPEEITRAVLLIDREDANYGKHAILKCDGENRKGLDTYNKSNWSYIILTNVLDYIINTGKKEITGKEEQDKAMIDEVVGTLKNDKEYSKYADKIDWAAGDIKEYFHILNLFEYLKGIKQIKTTIYDKKGSKTNFDKVTLTADALFRNGWKIDKQDNGNAKNRRTLTISKEGISYTINMVVNGEIDGTKVTITTDRYSDDEFSRISQDIQFLKELAADEEHLKKMKVIQNEVSIDKDAIYVPYVATQVLHIIEEIEELKKDYTKADVTDLAVINLPNAKLLDKAIARMRDNVTDKVGITPTTNNYNKPIIEAINKEYAAIFNKRADEDYNGDPNKNNQTYKKKSPTGKNGQEALQLKEKPKIHIKQAEIQLTIHSDKNGAQNRLLQIRKAATDQMLRELMMDNIEKWVEICQEATEDTKTETQMSKLIQQLNKALPEAELEAIKANESQIAQLLRNRIEYEEIRQKIRRQVLTNKGVQETMNKLTTEIHNQMQDYNISEGITNCNTEPRWNTVSEYIEAILVGIYGRGANLSDDELVQKTAKITRGSLLMEYEYDNKVKIWNAEDKPKASEMEEEEESDKTKKQQNNEVIQAEEFEITKDKRKWESEPEKENIDDFEIQGQEKDELKVEHNSELEIPKEEKQENEIEYIDSLEIKREKAHKPDPNASLKVETKDAIELSNDKPKYNDTHESKPNKEDAEEDDMCEEVPLSLQQRIEKAEEQARKTGNNINKDLTSTNLNNSDKKTIDKEIKAIMDSNVQQEAEKILSEYNEKVNNATESTKDKDITKIQKLHYKLEKLQERIGNEDKFK